MAKFGLDINVKTEGAKTIGTIGRLGAKGRSDIREGLQQAQAVKKGLVQRGTTRDPAVRTNRQLSANIQRLDRSIIKLIKSIVSLSGNVRTAARSGGLGGGTGLPGRGGAGAGFSGAGMSMGRMGGALPIAGAILGAFGYAVSKVMQLGRASMAKVLEQRGAAGVAGFHRGGRYTEVFSAAEFGQYLRERRMAAGRFEAGGARGSREGTEYAGGAVTRAPLSIRATALFGTGSEFARTAGLMDISARLRGRTGEQDLSNVIRSTYRGRGERTRGIGTELPFLLREITSSMEDAVRNGVDASNVARDMATEMVQISRVTPGGQVRSSQQLQRSMIDIQQQAARGQGGVSSWRMNMAARSLLLNTGQAGQRVRNRLRQTGMLTQRQEALLGAGQQLAPDQMQFLVQALQGQQAGEVRTAFARDLMRTLGGEGRYEERRSRFHRIAQTMMPELNLTPQRSAQLFDHAQRMEAAERYDTLRSERTNLEQQYQGITGRRATVSDVANIGRTGGRQGDILRRMQAIDRDMSREITTRNTRGQLITQTLEQFGTNPANRAATQTDSENRMNQQLQRGRAVRGVMGQQGARESMLLNQTAAAARRAVITVERSFMDLAEQLRGPVTTGITTFNSAVIDLSRTAREVIQDVQTMSRDVREQGLGSYLMSRARGAFLGGFGGGIFD